MPTIFSRLSVYIAAVVILISWLISNTFVTFKEEDVQAMNAFKIEFNQFQDFSHLANGQRVLLRNVAEIEDSLDKLQKEGKHPEAAAQNDEDEADAQQNWVESFPDDSTQLAEDAQDLEDWAKRVQPSAELEQSVASSYQRAKAFDADVHKEANAYDQDRKAAHFLEARQDEANAEGRKKFNEQISADLKRIAKMEGPFDNLSKEIDSLYEKIESHMNERSERSASHATIARWIAYLFSALGTVFGGLGPWLENKNKVRPAT